MGKKGSWFSAIKRVFTPNSRDKAINEHDKKHIKEKKKWGLGKSRNGEANSFIPLHREPSSIEKILGDADREQQQQQQRIHQMPTKKEAPPKREPSSPKREVPPKQEPPPPKKEVPAKKELPSPNREVPPKKELHPLKKEAPPRKVQQLKTPLSALAVTTNYAQMSAIKIQAAYRGYMARKSYRSLKGLMRLQSVIRGQSVKRQTMNTMRCMQLLVRVQSQIRTRRLQMMESRNNQHHQIPGKSDNENERWSLTPQSEAEAHEEWDDSMLTKDEIDARMRRKVEAVIKRERALAYAYSHQLLKVTPKSAHAILSDVRSGGHPWWWTWLERQLHHSTTTARPNPTSSIPTTPTPRKTTAADTAHLRPSSRGSQLPSAATPRAQKAITRPESRKAGISSSRWSARDDESLTSCPPLGVPNYMAPTASASAKVREAPAVARGEEGKRQFSFGLSQSIGSLRWGTSKPKDSAARAQRAGAPRGAHRPASSIGSLSVDSTASLPVGFTGRKPFK